MPRRIALFATILPVLLVTLLPGRSVLQEAILPWCVVCGWRGASDAILNIALFVPFGLALVASRRSVPAAFAIGAAVSLGIEVAQVFIPGRYPGLGDVLYNSLGAGLGAAAFVRRGKWLHVPSSSAARPRTTAWVVAGLLALSIQSWLTGPGMPTRGQTVAWTPETPELNRYEGEVLGVSIGRRRVLPGSVASDDPMFAELREGTEISVRLVAGPVPRAIVPLLLLRDTEGEGEGAETFFLGVDGADLLIRYRTRGMSVRLDRPSLRWRGAASWTEGDTLTIHLDGFGSGIDVRLDGARTPTGSATRRLAIPSARGWGFLMHPERLERGSAGWLDFGWILLIAFPLGFWGPLRLALAGSGIWGAALMAAPSIAPLTASSPRGVAGALAGVLLGALARFVLGNPEPFRWWKPYPALHETATPSGPDGPNETGASHDE